MEGDASHTLMVAVTFDASNVDLDELSRTTQRDIDQLLSSAGSTAWRSSVAIREDPEQYIYFDLHGALRAGRDS